MAYFPRIALYSDPDTYNSIQQVLMVDYSRYLVQPGQPFSLASMKTNETQGIDEDEAKKREKKNLKKIVELQERLFARTGAVVADCLAGHGHSRQRQHDPGDHQRPEPPGLPRDQLQGANEA